MDRTRSGKEDEVAAYWESHEAAKGFGYEDDRLFCPSLVTAADAPPGTAILRPSMLTISQTNLHTTNTNATHSPFSYPTVGGQQYLSPAAALYSSFNTGSAGISGNNQSKMGKEPVPHQPSFDRTSIQHVRQCMARLGDLREICPVSLKNFYACTSMSCSFTKVCMEYLTHPVGMKDVCLETNCQDAHILKTCFQDVEDGNCPKEGIYHHMDMAAFLHRNQMTESEWDRRIASAELVEAHLRGLY